MTLVKQLPEDRIGGDREDPHRNARTGDRRAAGGDSIAPSRARPWLILLGAIVGGAGVYISATAFQFTDPMTIIAIVLWGGIFGGNVVDLFRVRNGRLVFDKETFSARWGRESMVSGLRQLKAQAAILGGWLMFSGIALVLVEVFDS